MAASLLPVGEPPSPWWDSRESRETLDQRGRTDRGESEEREERRETKGLREKKALVCKEIQVFLVPLVLEATLVLMVSVAHKALLVHQVPEDSKVHQEYLWST